MGGKGNRCSPVGIDLSSMATKRASERAGPLGMSGRATFSQGTFETTGLEPASADAVMSVDALQYVPDKSAALVEVARILRPRGRFAFVAFELDPDRVAGLPLWEDAISDYRPLLEQVGFEVNQYGQIPTGKTKSQRASVRSSPSETLWKPNSVKRQRRQRSWRRP